MVLYVREGSKREQCCLLGSCTLSVTSPATYKWIGPFWYWFLSGWVCVHLRTPWVPPVDSPVRLGVSPTASTPIVFSVRGFEALFPWAGTLGCVVCLAPQLFLPVYPHGNVGLPSPPATTSPTWSTSCHLSIHPLSPGCLSLPLLPVWMKVSSLTPWLSNFHTVWFSGSSGHFLFLNWLLSFWLCKEAKHIYLGLHVGQKSSRNILKIYY